jgi:hypothetical protein
MTCPLPRQARPGSPRVEFRVMAEDALLVEGNSPPRAPPGRALVAMVGQGGSKGVTIWNTVRGKAAVPALRRL